ncbi:MAG: NHL repeat-containing protein [Verrucomicrobiota bacterium]|nr:NHL repeat-containing protein [Verrucomicrobiota bacterium]
MKKLSSVSLLAGTLALGAMTSTLAHAQVFVANYGDNSIWQYDSSGHGTVFVSSSSGLLNGPSALAFDSSGNLFVGNFGLYSGNKYEVDGFDPSGNLITTLSLGLNVPAGLAFDSSGDLFVANNANNTSSGNIEEFAYTSGSLSTSGTTFASLVGVYGLAFDSGGNLYAASLANNTITEFNSGGSSIATISSGLNSPWGLAFDNSGNLYAADSGNGAVEKFAATGPGTVSGTGTTFASGLSQPAGLAFDNNTNLFVADLNGNKIEQYNSSGNGALFTTNNVNNPTAVATKPVPEPTACGLLIMGVGALFGLRNRKGSVRS